MSWMYLYWAFQSSEEFSALETNSIAISFLSGADRSEVTAAGLVDTLSARKPAVNSISALARRRLRKTWSAVFTATILLCWREFADVTLDPTFPRWTGPSPSRSLDNTLPSLRASFFCHWAGEDGLD